MEIGENIRKYRKNCGFTQEELARLLHVTAQAVSRWESGAGKPDVSMLVPLAKTLGVSLDTLFDTGIAGEEERGTVSQQLERVRHSDLPREEMYLQMYRILRKAADRNLSDFDLLEQCIVLGCYIVKYCREQIGQEFGGLEAIVQDCERKATAVIRYSTDRKLIESVHSYMSWTYEFMGQYDKAKEHIMELPTYESVQMRESMLAQLALFQQGFDAEMACINNNMKTLSVLVCNELQRSMMDIAQHGSPEQAAAYKEWILAVAEAFCCNPYAAEPWAACISAVKRYEEFSRRGEDSQW